MGIYIYSAEEVADVFEDMELESKFQGDFTEADFLEGANIYLKRLRKQGAYIPKGKNESRKPKKIAFLGRYQPKPRKWDQKARRKA